MADTHKNFAVSAVATAPSPATSGTSLVVTAGHGTRFPTPPFNAVVCPAATAPTPANAEVVRVTGIATNTFTIQRAQEGSTARTIVVGDQIYAAVTAKSFTDIEGGVYVAGGTADDTAAVQAAITAGWAKLQKGVVYTIGNITLPSNVLIDGNGATITRKAGVTGALFAAGAAISNVTCKGATFDNAAAAFGHPIFEFIAGSSYVEISGNRFTNFNSHVIRSLGGSVQSTHFRITDNVFLSAAVSNTLTTDLIDTSWVWFERNYVENTGMFKDETSSGGGAGGTMHHIFVRNNLVRNADASCTLIRNNGVRTIEDVVVSGNQGYSIGSATYTKGLVTVGENAGAGSTSARARRITVSNNVAKDFWGPAIVIGGGPNPGVMEDVAINGNVIDASKTDDTIDTARSSIGIQTYNGWHQAISGNSIKGCGLSGIRVESVSGAASQASITGNHVSLCAQNPAAATVLNEGGILTYGTVKDVSIVGNVCIDSGSQASQGCAGINGSLHVQTGHIISGNRCTDTRGTPFQDYGIAVGASGANGSQPTNFTISDNDVRGNVTAGIKVWASIDKAHTILHNPGSALNVAGGVAGTDAQVFTLDSAKDAGIKFATPSGGGGGSAQVLSADVGPITSQTTLQDVTGLGLAIGASATEIWLAKFWLLVSSANATMDYKLGFTVPAGCTMKWGFLGAQTNFGGFGPALTSASPIKAYIQTDVVALGSFNNDILGVALTAVVFGGGTAGTVQLQYAQNTSDAGALKILKGSVLEPLKVQT